MRDVRHAVATVAAAPTPGAAEPHGVMRQVTVPVAETVERDRVGGLAGAAIEVVLRPEGLGRVHVGARMVDGRVNVDISCDSDTTAAAVRATIDELREHLHGRAVTAADVIVVHRAPEWSTATDGGAGGSGADPWATPERGGDGSGSTRAHDGLHDARPPPALSSAPSGGGGLTAPPLSLPAPDLDLSI